MNELELKLRLPEDGRERLLADLRRGQVERVRLAARYFDTSDWLLARHAIALRLRREGRHWVQTLKAAGESVVERLEHNADAGFAKGGVTPALDISLHDGTPVGERLKALVQEAAADGTEPVLVEMYATDVVRTLRELRANGGRVEVAFDEGTILAGARQRPVCELELELKAGRPDALFSLAERWLVRHRLWLDVVPKSERGRLLATGHDALDAVRAQAPRLDRAMDGEALLRAVVASCLAQVLPNASEVAAGSQDEEHVHQLRVGIRRLRTALRELGEFSSAVNADWEPPLVEAFRALGGIRDQQAIARSIEPELAAAGAPDPSWPATAGTRESPADLVRDASFQQVLLALLAFVHRSPDADPTSNAPATNAAGPADADSNVGSNDGSTSGGDGVHQVLRRRLKRLHRSVERDGARFDKLAPEEQHRTRKRLKRLRYLAEFVTSLFDSRDVRRYLARLKPAQDALGKLNDHAVALQVYRDAAAHHAPAWFAVGWLTARRDGLVQACKRALDDAADAPRFWRKGKRKSG
ncbi:MAG TPA: CYTH and CHAD domain-containing protein [Burkholderiaceae bacterium]|nr:CYTH and CHAD domain-containing protein [Burkholderiaceae bacterium]